MDWLNLHSSVLDSPEVVGSGPIERATWLFLLRLCIGQENGGRILDCKGWSDRKWQQVARVTSREVLRKSGLWEWHGSDMVVCFYPLAKEQEVRKNREHGKRGGAPRKNHPVTHPVKPNGTTRFDLAITEGKGIGKEGEGKDSEVTPPAPLKHSEEAEGADPEGDIARAKPLPMPAAPVKVTWVDWRAMHGGVYVGREGSDGGPADWEALWRLYGAHLLDPMYSTLRALNPGKPIYYNVAAKWLEDNTTEDTARKAR